MPTFKVMPPEINVATSSYGGPGSGRVDFLVETPDKFVEVASVTYNEKGAHVGWQSDLAFVVLCQVDLFARAQEAWDVHLMATDPDIDLEGAVLTKPGDNIIETVRQARLDSKKSK